MRPRILWYCLLAGAMDSLTGLLLVTAPLETLALMGLTRVPSEPVYLRFVGAFVAAVGLSYLYPLLSTAQPRGPVLRATLTFTALVRLSVALFVFGAIAARALEAGWALVGATDAGLALAQIAMLRSRRVDVFA